MSAQFAQSFAGIGNLSKLLQPQIGLWAAKQQQFFASLSRSFVTPALGKQLASFATPSVNEQMRSVGLTASVRKAMFPTLQAGLLGSLAVGTLRRQTLLAQRVRLPDSLYGEFSKSLRHSVGPYGTQTLTPALDALTRRQTFSIAEVLTAAREAAELAEQQGERTQAQALTTLTAEVVEVVEAPSVGKLERMVGDLSKQLNEIQEQQAANEERRQSDHQKGQTLAVLLFVLHICLAFFVFLLEGGPKK